jgi:hypothetical protein
MKLLSYQSKRESNKMDALELIQELEDRIADEQVWDRAIRTYGRSSKDIRRMAAPTLLAMMSLTVSAARYDYIRPGGEGI